MRLSIALPALLIAQACSAAPAGDTVAPISASALASPPAPVTCAASASAPAPGASRPYRRTGKLRHIPDEATPCAGSSGLAPSAAASQAAHATP
jgi:hypothetical protein